ncbi:MAG: radical SAM protein [Candidatus Acidiferrum sp.]
MTVKIVLADPAAPAWNSYMRSFPNLGLLYLAAHLRREMPDVAITYLDANHSIEQHLLYLAQQKPAVYGLSFASPLNAVAKHILRKVREVLPEALIVCGGPQPTANPQDVLSGSPADICCIGEGEETFVELVRTFVHGGDVTRVAGIAYRGPNGDAVFTTRRPIIHDLDSIPLPAWDLVDLRRFRGLRQAKSGPSTAITASRGCAFNCTFCSNPIWKNATPWVRRRSPEKIAEEVELLYRRGIREIYIRSDLMNDKLDWAIAVFDALRDLDHPDLYFQCNLHLSRITSDFAKSMRRANCWLCNVGLESGSQRVLDGIKKKTKLAEVETRLQTLRDQGIKVYAFMMMYQLWESGQGLEVETTREVFQSVRLVLSLWSKRLLNQMSWAYATPYPGSDLYRVCKKYGLLPHNFDESMVSSDVITIPIPGLSKFEIMVARLAGLFAQLLLNMSNRERYERHALIPNTKHAIVKLRQLLMDFRKPIVQGKSAPQISRSKSLQNLEETTEGQQGVSTLVQIDTGTI